MGNSDKSWVRICPVEEIPAGKAVNLYINGQRLVMARCGDSARVLQGYCSHMLFYLKDAKVDDCILTCSLHQSQFDIRDGSVVRWTTENLTGPMLEQIKQKKGLRVYETDIRDGVVYLAWPAKDPDKVRVRF
jgi:nitrite reductase/ring-hydroxylating ferredoxin subunit